MIQEKNTKKITPASRSMHHASSINVNPRSGFTLIEMLITLGIMAILAAATISSITQSRDHVRLNQSAQEIAGLFREAQARAIGVTPIVIGGNKLFPGYGVLVNKESNGTEALVLFADENNNGSIDDSIPATVISKFVLPAGISMVSISDGVDNTFKLFSAIYNRPDPDISFELSANDFSTITFTGENTIDICLVAIRDSRYKVVSVWKTGQVSVSEMQNDCN